MTLGAGNGLGLSAQVLSLALATGSSAGAMSAADKTKLNGIAYAATANQTDAFLLARDNQTGTQAISTVTSLQSTLDGKLNLSGGTIGGDLTVTGGGTLNMDGGEITNCGRVIAAVVGTPIVQGNGPYLTLSGGGSGHPVVLESGTQLNAAGNAINMGDGNGGGGTLNMDGGNIYNAADIFSNATLSAHSILVGGGSVILQGTPLFMGDGSGFGGGVFNLEGGTIIGNASWQGSVSFGEGYHIGLYGVSNQVELRANPATTGYSFSFPIDGGTSGYVLSTDGSGITSWIEMSGGGGGSTQALVMFSPLVIMRLVVLSIWTTAVVQMVATSTWMAAASTMPTLFH